MEGMGKKMKPGVSMGLSEMIGRSIHYLVQNVTQLASREHYCSGLQCLASLVGFRGCYASHHNSIRARLGEIKVSPIYCTDTL